MGPQSPVTVAAAPFLCPEMTGMDGWRADGSWKSNPRSRKGCPKWAPMAGTVSQSIRRLCTWKRVGIARAGRGFA